MLLFKDHLAQIVFAYFFSNNVNVIEYIVFRIRLKNYMNYKYYLNIFKKYLF